MALLAASQGYAGDILRGGAPAGKRGGKGAGGAINLAAEQTKINAKDALARTTRAVQTVKLMQDAARAAAMQGLNNLGQNPNRPGQALPNVPDGLVRGGLQVAPGVPKNLANPQTGENASLWRGALLPKQTVKDGQKIVTIDQLKPQAVLNWETFNIGKKTTLKFNQNRGGADKSQWTAFNKINDPSGAPSQILGKIEAPGQVYVINPNGIMFGGSSQINLHGLVASSLPINDGLVARGLLSNPDSQFLFSALPMAAGVKGTPAFTPTPSNAPGGKYGDVVVQTGAKIISPTTGANVGGRVMLVGPNVKNEGTIETPDGQTVLAAGLQVGIAAHPSSDARLRGLDVYVGAVAVPPPANSETPSVIPAQRSAGTATNTGLIDAPRANVTITGKTVNQFGAINSSTSVTLNGSIHLLANFGAQTVTPVAGDPFFAFTGTGTIWIGPESAMLILPELFSDKTVAATELALRSRVVVQGRNIHFGSDSTLFAPNADVELNAGRWLPDGDTRLFTYSSGQIYLDAGAMINVAGSTDISVAIAQNILSLELRGAELADSPLQRGGPLRGPTLNLDVRQRGVYNGREWVGTPLGDASGYVNLIERGVGELTAAGGTVTMNAGGSVVMQSGSKVDVSGGYINFEGGMVKTTRVMSDGRIVDIANATPDREFTGLYDGTFTSTHPKYGIVKTWANPLALSGEYFDPGYVDGRSGGKISITAPSMALDGELIGQTVEGPRQRTAALAPKLSSLALTFEGQDAEVLKYQRHSPTPPAITFGAGVLDAVTAFQLDAAGNARPLQTERLAQVFLSPELFTKFGFGSVTINNPDGSVVIPEETELEVRARGSLTVTAANLDIQGSVRAPGGTLSFTAYNFTPYHDHVFPPGPGVVKVTPPPDPSRGKFSLGENATLSVAGLIVDDRATSADALLRPLATDGGSISIAAYSVALGQGSMLDASGGVAFARDGRRSFGAGGSISVKAGNDPKAPQIIGGTLDLGGTIQAFSGTKGGALTIQAPSVQIGGTTVSSPNTFHVQPEFFLQGGFTSYTLIGLGEPIAGRPNEYLPAVLVAPNTTIKPVAESWTALSYAPELGGPRLVSILQPEGVRAPASLTLSAPGIRDTFSPDSAVVTRGDLFFSEGASIVTDGRGAIALAGESVTVLGSLIAPGGSISVSGSGNPSLAFGASAGSNLTSVHLGAQSLLSAAGKVIYTPNPFGQRTGVVLPGGRVSVSGNIVAEAGAVLDVSGASGILDLAPAVVNPGSDVSNFAVVPANSGVNSTLFSRVTVPTRVDSDGGEIVLAGGQHLFSDATLLGNAGGPSALGGSLTISSGRFRSPDGPVATPLDPTLLVKQSGATIPGRLEMANGTSVGTAVRAADGSVVQGMGYFAVETFAKGGFDSLTLRGSVQFAGDVSIDARRALSVADAGVLYADSNVTLSAPYVVLGTPFRPPFLAEQAAGFYPYTSNGQPFHFEPTHGPGNLKVIADLIDIGNLSLQNIGRAEFIANGGDIRGDGTFQMAGSLLLRAAQIYPPTAVTFNIAVYDYTVGEETLPGSITIEGSGFRQLPWSAGGQLNIHASNIHQAGTIRAPMGGINLGWNGDGEAPVNPITNEAFPIASSVVLAPGSLTSVSAVPPDGGVPLVIPYGLNVNGVTWIDPLGRDITAGGVTQKVINIGGLNVNSMEGSQVDIQGGGDLFSYRWVQGIGGTKDILASTGSFAVVPGYGSNFAPYAPFNPAPLTPGLDGDPGYTNSALKVGDRIHLRGGAGLPEGEYTLLPARYALMPGAFLVTQKSGTPVGRLSLPDGSTLVPGYRYNELNQERTMNPQYSWFEVLSENGVRDRADYGTYFANEFLFVGARVNESLVPRLPADAGHLTLQASTTMVLNGTVFAHAPAKRRGGLVDIASPTDILINATGGSVAGKLVLDARQLSSFGAESLLIGGIRNQNGLVSTVAVKTNNLTVDNAGSPLTGPEIILVAKEDLVLESGASIIQEGNLGGRADLLQIGTAGDATSGNGTLIRVTSDASASIVRAGITNSTVPTMKIGAGVNITGTSVILDSTAETELDPTARLNADFIALNSGQISLQLDNAGPVNSTGLILAGDALRSLESSSSVSLLSYSSIDFYGTGAFSMAGRLALHAAQIRGFDQGTGTVEITASALRLDNSANGAVLAGAGPATGTLSFNAGVITLGANQLAIERFGAVELNATRGIVGSGSGGIFAQQDLVATTPVLTAQRSATQSIRAGGALSFNASGAIGVNGGLGASLTLQGASVTSTSDILLPSGSLTVRATNGDVSIGGRVLMTGTAQTFYDQVRFTGGGQARFISDTGSIAFAPDTVIDVSAAEGGGDAGRLSISAANGSFTNSGSFVGHGGEGGLGGEFILDTGSLANFGNVQTALETGGFDRSQQIRVRTGDVSVDGIVRASDFRLSTDQGRITVTGTGRIDASDHTGGSISLAAGGSVILESGARLTVAAEDFNSAGKGGAIFLETRGTGGGVVDIRSGSTIDLGVAANNGSSASFGKFTGTLHLRAPQISGNTDLGIATIGGNINGASVIIAEGFRVYNTAANGAITSTLRNDVQTHAAAFMNGGYASMLNRVSGGNAALQNVLSLRPGVEIVNAAGNLTLGSASSGSAAEHYANDWNLANLRFGPRNAPGVLTLRASGDIRLFNSISDGFETARWNSLLKAYNPNLPANAQSWDLRFTAGADFAAADFTQVRPLSTATTGSLILGRDLGSIQVPPGQVSATPPTEIGIATGAFQVVRTGSGNITVNASRDVQFRNEFASIYTVGTQVANASVLPNGGTFDVPVPTTSPTSDLGPNQRVDTIPAQYSLGGGNITINAGNDVTRVRLQGANLVASSSKQMPTNWLYRRGLLDAESGQFATGQVAGSVDSTTWWVDYANFFEGVGTLGGGNIAVNAGRDVANVDAVAPTNARMGKGLPNAEALVELGGGDVTIRAGRDINAGVYYVERGKGTLNAGGSIMTNSTRTMELGTLLNLTNPKAGAAETWLPTTLFLGKASFDVSARGDLLLGPAANPFLLPAGFNNSVRYKTYFSTYSADSAVNITSLSGSVTLRVAAAPNDAAIESATPILAQWYTRHMRFGRSPSFTSANYQPWLLLNETNPAVFQTALSLMPATLRVNAFAGDINVVGRVNLTPSPTGTAEFLAAGSINGLNPNGAVTINGTTTKVWGTSSINISDASPTSIPSIAAPLGFLSTIPAGSSPVLTGTTFLSTFDNLFAESGSTRSVLQTKQALHAPGLLHSNDAEPVRMYAGKGDVSSVTLFSPKATRIVAGRDIADVAFYLQHVGEEDISVIAAGRDIVAYNANTQRRVAAVAPGNALETAGVPLAGDLQIAGAGTLEVLAGRNLDLGSGAINADGTGAGIVSIGNARNPYLPFAGADLVIGAGVGPSTGLFGSNLDFTTFVSNFVEGPAGERYKSELTEILGGLGDASDFEGLDEEQQRLAALNIFYLMLRDAGRDHNDPASPGFENYDGGFAAIESLFPGAEWKGEISMTSRQIKTQSGGSISMFAPGGRIVVGFDAGAGQALDQGILTESGGDIRIFAHESVTLGTSRIFTLRGGNEIIWSSTGDIAAGTSSKTVASAPPTRVLIDPQSADLKTDLAGLATGGGIGVLATVAGVTPGDVDLIAPNGAIDAGDAGIRVSGNLNISATQVLNAENIQVAGASAGAPSSVAVAAPVVSVSAPPPPPTTQSTAPTAAQEARKREEEEKEKAEEAMSVFTIEILGYGGGESASL